nr:hypothetical protein BaRGS_017791 [Batillaria attramentaria]
MKRRRTCKEKKKEEEEEDEKKKKKNLTQALEDDGSQHLVVADGAPQQFVQDEQLGVFNTPTSPIGKLKGI